MSIATAIQNIRTKIAAAYTTCDNKEATMPAADSRNLTNLSTTIGTIETPIPVNQTIQKVIATEVSSTQILSTLDNSNTTSSDLTSEGIAQNETNTYLTLQVSGASEYGVSITAKNYTPQYYGAITYFVDKYVNGAWNGVASDVNSLRVNSNGTGTCSNSSISTSGLRIGAYYNNSKYRSLTVSYSDFLAGADFEIVAKEVTYTDVYTREFENVGTITVLNTSKYQNNTSLVSVMMPDTITNISSYAFDGCTNLKYVNLENVSTINTYAFSNCTSLKMIELLSPSLTTIPSTAFYGCTSLLNVTLSQSITTLGGSSFYNCTSLSSINLENVVTIGEHALRNIKALPSEMTINATSIDSSAFRDDGIERIILPNVVTIGQYAFNECKCAYVEIGSSCTTIGGHAFDSATNENYVANRIAVCRATTPPSAGSDMFRQYYNGWKYDVKIYVPYSSDHSVLNAYKDATNWVSYASNIYELNQDGTIPV